MKRKVLIYSASALAIVILAATIHLTALFHPSGDVGDSVEPFLTTNWRQSGGYNKFTPGQNHIGCWGTAFAQIMFHYGIKPSGQVAYETSTGYVVEEDLDAYNFDFSKFTSEINELSDEDTIDQMAMYNYFTAAVVQKDFGTGNGSILHKTEVGAYLKKHFGVDANWYVAYDGLYPYTAGKLEWLVERELSAKRPVYFYFTNQRDMGHAVVIDGYRRTEDAFMVHMVQGQGGPDNGWYDFHGPILDPDDGRLRIVYTVHTNT
ncbi:MAG: hypothetical protein DHS20C11_02360 [Lysobacteraceae bacterium]|nr:MAG: hypothetical protein DHS20C11_02360 [Xanthomonadaceae bacterium]